MAPIRKSLLYDMMHHTFCHWFELLFFLNPLTYGSNPMALMVLFTRKGSPLMFKNAIMGGLARVLSSTEANSIMDSIQSHFVYTARNGELCDLMYMHFENCPRCKALQQMEIGHFQFAFGFSAAVRLRVTNSVANFIPMSPSLPLACRVDKLVPVRHMYCVLLRLLESVVSVASALTFPESMEPAEPFQIPANMRCQYDAKFVRMYVNDHMEALSAEMGIGAELDSTTDKNGSNTEGTVQLCSFTDYFYGAS